MWDENASISLTDSSGKSYSAKIIEKDDDDLEIYVKGIKDGTNYTANIQGIKAVSYTHLTTGYSLPFILASLPAAAFALAIFLMSSPYNFKRVEDVYKRQVIESDENERI